MISKLNSALLYDMAKLSTKTYLAGNEDTFMDRNFRVVDNSKYQRDWPVKINLEYKLAGVNVSRSRSRAKINSWSQNLRNGSLYEAEKQKSYSVNNPVLAECKERQQTR